MNKILVVAAHPDDEILGVGATILKHVARGDEINILILGDGETSKDGPQDTNKRARQAKQAAKFLAVKKLVLKTLPDQKFDSLPILDITKQIEAVVSQIKPQIIYTHCPTDLNMDHRITCQSVLTACRPKPGFSVKKILAFVTLSSTEWQLKNGANLFCPTQYEDVTDFIDKKIEALKIYQGELLEYPHPRSEIGVRVLAQYRGMEVGFKYAEAFQIVRELND